MISWWWIIPAFIFGGTTGCFIMALLVASKMED